MCFRLADVSKAFISTLLSLFIVSGQAATPTDAVIATFQFSGGQIVGLSAGPNGEVAVYDRTPGVSHAVMRFLQAYEEVGGGIVVNEAPETIVLAGDSPQFKGWMVRDGWLLYALSSYSKATEWGLSSWDQMWLYIISSRDVINAINFNGTAEIAGDEPWAAPEDFRYAVNGFALKPAGAEQGSNPRIVIDDTLKGNVDILELDASGVSLVDQVRYSYRGRLESNCEWPDIDPGPTYNCNWMSIAGNGLTLDWAYETRVSMSEPNLFQSDELYILDPISSKAHIRRIEISESLNPFWATEKSQIALENYDFMLANGVESLHSSPIRDEILMASGMQSFNAGYVPIIETLHLTGQVLDPVYGDEEMLIPDRSKVNHWFIPVADSFISSPSLILREVVNGAVVNSVAVLLGYDYHGLDAATFDPVYGLAYLALGDTVYVVSVTTPDGTDKDGDGLPIDYELAHGLDPDDPTDARLDVDGDGWNYVDEYHAGTDPDDPDSDNDGISDRTDPMPTHQDDCTTFIQDGVLTNVVISGPFSCTLTGDLTIQGDVEVTADGQADIDARNVYLKPWFRAFSGGGVRLR